MVAVPAKTAVTKPVAETVATEVLLLLHVTALFVALAGAMVAVNWVVEPVVTERDVALSVTPVTATVGVVTVIRQVAVLFPSLVLTVMVVVPTACAVTSPLDDTMATEVLLLLKVTFLFEALAGVIVGVS
jgi:hypothetical protein